MGTPLSHSTPRHLQANHQYVNLGAERMWCTVAVWETRSPDLRLLAVCLQTCLTTCCSYYVTLLGTWNPCLQILASACLLTSPLLRNMCPAQLSVYTRKKTQQQQPQQQTWLMSSRANSRGSCNILWAFFVYMRLSCEVFLALVEAEGLESSCHGAPPFPASVCPSTINTGPASSPNTYQCCLLSDGCVNSS